MENWYTAWESNEYIDAKLQKIEKLKLHIKSPPKNILDIGCGPAIESEYFQKEYGSYLYLLDGNKTSDKKREVSFGSVDTMNFYNDIETLREDYDSRNLNYTFLDATGDIELPDIKFDLVYSFLSCGFHYPVTEYLPMLKSCTDENSLIMFDIRRDNVTYEDLGNLRDSAPEGLFFDQVKHFEEYDIIYTDPDRRKKYYTVKVKL